MSAAFGFLPLCERNLRAWRPYALAYLLRMVEMPMQLYVYGFGLGVLGAVFAKETGYTAFVLPGLIVWSLWLAVIIEATYTTFIRAFSYRLWESVLMTPVRLPAILMAEQAIGVAKGLFLMVLAYPFAVYFNAVPSHLGFFIALLPALLFVMVVTAFGHFLTSIARSEFDFDTLWPLYAMPMFLTSGVMFPRHMLPAWLQILSEIFPMTHAIEAMRPVMLGAPNWPGFVLHCAALLLMWVIFSGLAYHFFKKRLYQ